MTDAERIVAWGDELIKLHDSFRRDLAGLRASGGLDAIDLPTHCLAFCDRLHAHHQDEDQGVFPHLREQHPELADVLERLDAEHQVVARLLEEIRRRLASRSKDTSSTIDRLTRELEAHFDYEEEQLVPLLNQLATLPGTG